MKDNFFDTSFAVVGVSTVGTVTAIDAIPQGNTDSTRNGVKIFNRCLYMKWVLELQNQGVASVVGDTVRIMVIRDNQSNGAATTVANILQTASIVSHQKWDTEERIDILYDEMFDVNCLSQDAAAGSTVTCYSLEEDVDIMSEEVFNSGTTNVQTGSISVLLISANGVCNANGVCRLVYVG